MRATAGRGLGLLAALAAVACSNAGEGRVTGLSATGQVTGFVLVDANGSRVIDQGDDSLPGITVRLVLKDGPDTGLAQVTQPNGSYRFLAVPVGVYRLTLDTTTFGDTLRVVRADSASFTVLPGDTARINALAGLPLVTVRQARALAPGRKVFVVGVALNGASTFADSVVHFADTSGTIRLVDVRGVFQAGDSLRVRATSGLRQGQPALGSPAVFGLGQGGGPAAVVLTSQSAAAADGGARDAQLVIVRGATISDTARTATSFVLTVDDSSGPLEVQLDGTASGSFAPASLPGVFVPGNRFDVLGVLAPTGTTAWRLRPRSAVDLTQIPLPVLSIAAVRALPAGRRVVVVGVALNGSGTFADSTVHLADGSGVIRLTRLRTSVAAGDSVRVQATTAGRDGQPTLDGGTGTALGRGFFPTAATLTTLDAASAAGGTRDAELVRVRGAIVSDTVRTATSFVLTASDSSGPLEVQLDRLADASFQPGSLPGVFVPGNKFDLLGLLAPTGSGTWRLKPRSAVDVTQIPLPVLSIAAARALPAGRRVVVVGVALNGSATLADTTVHLADTSGAIRLTRLRASVAAGDSVRVQATTASRNGQPTLDAGSSTALGQGLFPTAPTLTTLDAATAAGGTRDAQLVVISNATISDTTRVLGNFRLTVSDGSGDLVVQLDQTAGFAVPGLFVPGNAFDVVGVLVPTGTGSWMLKPRSAVDLRQR